MEVVDDFYAFAAVNEQNIAEILGIILLLIRKFVRSQIRRV